MGVGAQCSVLTKYMHPAKLVNKKFPNRTTHSRIENLICIDEDNKLVNKKQQGVITFRHDDFEGTVIYCVRRWAKVLQEGATEHFFKILDNAPSNGGTPQANNVREEGEAVEVVQEIFHAKNSPKDTAMVRNQGLDVDCDNDPAPENFPTEEPTVSIEQEWGWRGTCNRATTAAQNHRPSIVGIHGVTLEVMSMIGMLLIFLPRNYLEHVICKLTSKKLSIHLI